MLLLRRFLTYAKLRASLEPAIVNAAEIEVSATHAFKVTFNTD